MLFTMRWSGFSMKLRSSNTFETILRYSLLCPKSYSSLNVNKYSIFKTKHTNDKLLMLNKRDSSFISNMPYLRMPERANDEIQHKKANLSISMITQKIAN